MAGNNSAISLSLIVAMHPKHISIKDFTYVLPEDRIAAYPLAERDESKLLIYQDGQIREDIYRNISAHLPHGAMLVFNNTRVIQARILFQKPTGGVIEIFCLEPHEAVNEYSRIMAQQGRVRWKCMIGGASKWKTGHLEKISLLAPGKELKLEAHLVEKLPEAYVVELSWLPAEVSFAEVIELMGDTPLPPYLKRKAGDADKHRYQTIYAQYDGSVAAPTAGLHFTPQVFEDFQLKNITKGYVTLHVGAGTFKPVKAELMDAHEMHAEWIDVTAAFIRALLANLPNGVIAVGTTSVRTLESLYWMGVKTILNPSLSMKEISIHQWDVYEEPLLNNETTSNAALEALLAWMQANNIEQLVTQTQILLAPGYRFRIPAAIITNFHQPQSTLLLLVAAAIGEDWKTVYQYALENNFRFLSYGDGCLLFLPRYTDRGPQ